MNCYLGIRWFTLGLCLFISIDGLGPAVMAQTGPGRIEIVVVAGERAASGLRQRVTQDPAVRIEDDDHRPVPGVPVVFALPVSGTSGEFANGAKTVAVMTDQDGVAAARGLRTNDLPGKLQIYITASFHGLHARALINQAVEGTSSSPTLVRHASKSGGAWKWVVLGVVAAGGAAAAGIHFSGHTSPGSPISVTAGTVMFGGPH